MSIEHIFASASRSVTGELRRVNQDRRVVDEELGFALLADGVAGRPAGERAAETAIQAASLQLSLVLRNGHCRDVVTARRLVGDAFGFAHAAVRGRAERDDALAKMASTLVAAVFVAGHAVIGSLGDSRVYRHRHGLLERLTDDHVVQREGHSRLSDEESAALRSLRLLTRAVGYDGFPEPDIFAQPLAPGDVFLLCSNGLSDALEGRKIGEILSRISRLEQACELLVAAAAEMGAEDDVSVVLVQPEHAGSIP